MGTRTSASKPKPKYRVGDWVVFPLGPQFVAAEVVEDRGLLDIGRHRLYGVRFEFGGPDLEPTYTEVGEEQVMPAFEAGRRAWQTKSRIGQYELVSYRKHPTDAAHHYAIGTRPDDEPGSGVALVYDRDRPPELRDRRGPDHVIAVTEGGMEAAPAEAERFVDTLHPGATRTARFT